MEAGHCAQFLAAARALAAVGPLDPVGERGRCGAAYHTGPRAGVDAEPDLFRPVVGLFAYERARDPGYRIAAVRGLAHALSAPPEREHCAGALTALAVARGWAERGDARRMAGGRAP